MPIHFRCQACDRMLSIATRKAGQQVGCPKCGKMVSVPAAAGVAIASEPLGNAKQLEALPLFERNDFEELLGPAVKKVENTEPLKPLPVPMPVPEDDSGEAELLPIDGVVISRGRMTLLAVTIAVLLAVSFAVGYFLARATSGKKEATIQGYGDVMQI